MKKILAGLLLVLVAGFCGGKVALAEECGAGAGVLVNPISKNLTIEGGNSRIDDSFTVQNQANKETVFKIYAAPYSDDENKKDFESETTYTQISRWIKFLDASGGVVDTLEIRVAPCAKREVNFRVLVPESIPDGGQYAVIFTESENSGGDAVISSSSRVGMLIYAHVNGGETVREFDVAESYLEKGVRDDKTAIYAGIKITNNGNIDSDVKGTLVIKTLLGREVYNKVTGASLLPGSSRTIENIWEETPYLGLFVADYTVEVDGKTEVVMTKVILILPLPILVVIVLALIVVVVGIVSFIKKRRNRKLF
ncbi:MAG: hypothetical protein K6G36_01355 [Candidatus Saccharibacteria bacterium]|nr:hypothetical protein [Candidatus Saccharibacteria bacterium]